MTTTFSTESTLKTSPRSIARLGGISWLITFVMGAVALSIYGSFVVAGDPAATASNLLARESTYRLGVAANLVATMAYLAATLFVYDLLRPVSRRISLLAAFFSLTACAISCVAHALQLAPLVVLRDAPHAAAFTKGQVDGLARLFLQTGEQTASVAFAFFGLHVLLIGVLILRSTFLHRAVGLLMLLGGLGWLTFAFANLLWPAFGRTLSPYILFPGILGEGALVVWLLVKGVNTDRWMAQAKAAQEAVGARVPELP